MWNKQRPSIFMNALATKTEIKSLSVRAENLFSPSVLNRQIFRFSCVIQLLPLYVVCVCVCVRASNFVLFYLLRRHRIC